MRILITGIGGFIGSHLAERFERDGHDVFGVDNLETGSLANWPKLCELDITRRHAFYDYANMVEPELIVHCAAAYKNPDHWHVDVDTNVAGMVNVLSAARHHQAKVVYFQTALPPVSSYAISKIAAEHYLHLSELPALVFRLANIYGPRNISGPLPAFFKRLSSGDRCTVARTSRDLVYIADLVNCVLQAISVGRVGVFDVCSGEATPILSLYRQVAFYFEDPPTPEVITPPVGDVPTAVSVKACLPGWSPEVGLAQGVADAVNWYRQNGVQETYTHLKMPIPKGKAA